MFKPKNKNRLTIKIRNMGAHGEGIGDYEGYTIFVEDALPGETVEVELYECKKRYARAHLINILEPSEHRVQPICPLFGRCGGCQIMHLTYNKQLEVKRQRVLDALQRLGKITDVCVEPCMPSPSSLHYRNKIQCPVRNSPQGISIGLYARSSHDLVDVDKCYIHCSLGEDIYEKVREIIKQSGIQAYDPTSGTGELRHVLIKSAVKAQEVLVLLVIHQGPSTTLKDIAKKIMDVSPQVKGVVYNLNKKLDNVILGTEYGTLEGADFIMEKLCGLQFKVSPASFFQVNPAQAESLYLKALEMAQIAGHERVLDAYCGVGTLSLIFARHAKSVIGIECVHEAIEDAKTNAALNQIENVQFICAPAEVAVEKLSDVDMVLLNPPRKGCDEVVLNSVIRLKPKTVLYISCDPATLARDLSYLRSSGYHIDHVQPFDMFPQTAHVETLVKLSFFSKQDTL